MRAVGRQRQRAPAGNRNNRANSYWASVASNSAWWSIADDDACASPRRRVASGKLHAGDTPGMIHAEVICGHRLHQAQNDAGHFQMPQAVAGMDGRAFTRVSGCPVNGAPAGKARASATISGGLGRAEATLFAAGTHGHPLPLATMGSRGAGALCSRLDGKGSGASDAWPNKTQPRMIPAKCMAIASFQHPHDRQEV